MELIIGKTFYKTNEFLKLGINSSGLIASSNIEFLQKKYLGSKLNNLDNFYLEDNLYIMDRQLEHKFKRPKTILLESNDTYLFIRDDIFPKIESDIKKDPVLDYKTYCKIEQQAELVALQELYKKFENTIDYNTFERIYKNEKRLGNITMDFDQSIVLSIPETTIDQYKTKAREGFKFNQ